MKSFHHSKGPDGQWISTETDVPDDDTEFKRRVKALADANPGCVAFGAQKSEAGAVQDEIVKLLEDTDYA